MRKVLIILLISLTIACTPKKTTNESEGASNPSVLINGEKLLVEEESYDYDLKRLIFYGVQGDEKRLLFDKKTDMVYTSLTLIENKAYFITNSELDKKQIACRTLWSFDGETGICESLNIPVYQRVLFSDNYRYIIYDYAGSENAVKYTEMILYTPVIRIYDLQENEMVREYNLEGLLFKEGLVGTVKIEKNNKSEWI